MRNLIMFFCLLSSAHLFADYCVTEFIEAGDPGTTEYRVGCDVVFHQVRIKVEDNSSQCLSSDKEFTLKLGFPTKGYDLNTALSEFYYFDQNGNKVSVSLSWTFLENDQVKDIAELCPYDGRWATAHARALLRHVGTYSYNDSLLCSGGGALINASANETKEAEHTFFDEKVVIINVFPNPTSSKITVLSNTRGGLEIINQLGQSVLAAPLMQESTELDLERLLPGLYTMLIRKNDKINHTEKVVKE